MIPFLLNYINNAEINTQYESEPITVIADDSVVATVTEGSILRNGADMGTSASVTQDDEVKVLLTSNAEHNKAKFAKLTIDDQESWFRITTKYPPPVPVYDTNFEGAHILDKNYSEDGQYFPSRSTSFYKVSGQNVESFDFELGGSSNLSFIFVDYYYNDFFVVDGLTTQGSRRSNISFYSGPYDWCFFDSHIWVTFFRSNRVVKFDTDLNQVESYYISKPIGIISDGSAVYVASYEGDSVYKIENGSASFAFSTQSNPGNILYDSANNKLHVVCCTGHLVEYNLTDSTKSELNLNSDAWGLAYFNGNIYVSSPGDGVVYEIDSSLSLINTISVGSVPASLASTATDLYIGEYESKTLYRYDGTDVWTVTLFNGGRALQMYSDGTDLWILNAYNDIPSKYSEIDYHPDSFYFTDRLGEGLDQTITSETITVSGINGDTNLQINSNEYDATLYVNGSAISGTQTLVSNGDEFYLSITSSPEIGIARQVFVVLGNKENIWTVKTYSANSSVPDSFYFNPVVLADPLSTHTSNTININGLTEGSSTQYNFSGSGTLYKNGVAVGSNTGIAENGDSFYIVQQASSAEEDLAESILSIGVAQASFCVTTKGASTFLDSSDATNIFPYKETFAPTSTTNQLEVFDSQGNKTTATLVENIDVEVPEEITVVVVGLYYEGKVFVVDRTTLEVYQTIAVNSPFYFSSHKEPEHYLSISSFDDDLVYIYENFSRTPLISFSLGGPTGNISKTPLYDNVKRFIVGAYNDNAINIYKYNDTTFEFEKSISVGNGPLYVQNHLETDFVWITCVKDNTIQRVNIYNNLVDTFSVGSSPWDLKIHGDYVYVLNAGDNTIYKLNLLNGSFVAGAKTGLLPFQMDIDLNEEIWVSHLESNTIRVFDLDLNLLKEFTIDNISYGIDSDEDGQHWVASFWPDTPVRCTETRDTYSEKIFEVPFDEQDTLLGEEKALPEIVVDDIESPIHINLSSVYFSDMLHNGQSSLSALVKPGDTLQFKYTTTVVGEYVHKSVITSKDSSNVITYTNRPDDTPELFVFDTIFDQPVREDAISNEIRISGLSPNHSSTLTTTEGTIIKNEVDTELQEVEVLNGDAIKIKFDFINTYGEKYKATIQCGEYITPFIVYAQTIKDVTFYFPVWRQKDSSYLYKYTVNKYFDLDRTELPVFYEAKKEETLLPNFDLHEKRLTKSFSATGRYNTKNLFDAENTKNPIRATSNTLSSIPSAYLMSLNKTLSSHQRDAAQNKIKTLIPIDSYYNKYATEYNQVDADNYKYIKTHLREVTNQRNLELLPYVLNEIGQDRTSEIFSVKREKVSGLGPNLFDYNLYNIQGYGFDHIRTYLKGKDTSDMYKDLRTRTKNIDFSNNISDVRKNVKVLDPFIFEQDRKFSLLYSQNIFERAPLFTTFERSPNITTLDSRVYENLVFSAVVTFVPNKVHKEIFSFDAKKDFRKYIFHYLDGSTPSAKRLYLSINEFDWQLLTLRSRNELNESLRVPNTNKNSLLIKNGYSFLDERRNFENVSSFAFNFNKVKLKLNAYGYAFDFSTRNIKQNPYGYAFDFSTRNIKQNPYGYAFDYSVNKVLPIFEKSFDKERKKILNVVNFEFGLSRKDIKEIKQISFDRINKTLIPKFVDIERKPNHVNTIFLNYISRKMYMPFTRTPSWMTRKDNIFKYDYNQACKYHHLNSESAAQAERDSMGFTEENSNVFQVTTDKYNGCWAWNFETLDIYACEKIDSDSTGIIRSGWYIQGG